MNIKAIKLALKGGGRTIAQFCTKHGRLMILLLVSCGVTTAIGVTACAIVFKKLETKHRKEDAEKYKKEFAKRIKDLEEEYKHNEYVLKKKINDLCKEFGIEPCF